jgi:hypothetical protein
MPINPQQIQITYVSWLLQHEDNAKCSLMHENTTDQINP